MQRLPKISPYADVLEHLADSLEAKWRRFGKDLKRCRKKFSNSAVHDTRVTTRRLLSTLELIGPFVSKGRARKAAKSLKAYLDGFSDVRDAHVQLEHVKGFRQFAAARPFKKWLQKRDAKFSRQAHKAVTKFDTRKLGRRIAALEKELRDCRQPNISPHAMAIVLRSIERLYLLVAELRGHIRTDDTKTIHCTRIAFKHFRYAVEELGSILAAVTPARCEQMHDYQSRMGDIQDMEIFLQAFDAFAGRKKMDAAPAEKFRREIQRRLQRLIEKFLREADKLNDFRL